MTVLELKSTVYLVPEVAWPVIKQNKASTGNRLQCYEVTSDAMGGRHHQKYKDVK